MLKKEKNTKQIKETPSFIKIPPLIDTLLEFNGDIPGGKIFLLTGPPGVGKTMTTELIAKKLKAKYIFIQCMPGLTEEELLYKYIPSPTTKSGIKIIPGKFVEALKLSWKKKVVLTLDEWDKTRPSADSFLLDFLQNYRVSWKIGKEDIIKGKKENMIIFLTSNNEREFSENLYRRVIAINYKLKSLNEMKKILTQQGVCEEHLFLLLQLYLDTIKARLEKPATIQELLQLHELLHMPELNISWDQLIYSIIIKHPESFKKFKKYLRSSSRELIYERQKQKTSKDKLYNKYNLEITIPNEKETPNSDEKEPPQSKIPKIKIKNLQTTKPEYRETPKTEEVHAFMKNENYEGLTAIVKELNPPVSHFPNKIKKFEIRKEGIITKKPLTLEEAIKLADCIRGAFIEINIQHVNFNFIKFMIRKSTKITSFYKREIGGKIELSNDKSEIKWLAKKGILFLRIIKENDNQETNSKIERILIEIKENLKLIANLKNAIYIMAFKQLNDNLFNLKLERDNSVIILKKDLQKKKEFTNKLVKILKNNIYIDYSIETTSKKYDYDITIEYQGENNKLIFYTGYKLKKYIIENDITIKNKEDLITAITEILKEREKNED